MCHQLILYFVLNLNSELLQGLVMEKHSGVSGFGNGFIIGFASASACVCVFASL